eukprot:TRINITY_DN31364_c0_g1_i1.p2 TRINITY_DN31364_c0_g1~~TRINITY_DN31364_c0_g1_i1.p2  ORF type:complete len:239 (+),score=28.56 TRINITY_DN31364_c0_g1_i1:257-973(+)
MPTFENWWTDMPPVTKVLFSLSMFFSLAAHFEFIYWGFLILDMPSVYKGFEIWRLGTSFFLHGLRFHYLVLMIFLVTYGSQLEKDNFAGVTADFVFFLLLSALQLVAIAWALHVRLLGVPLIMAIIYLWSRKNPDVTMTFMFGFQFKAFYFPWVLVAFNVLTGDKFPLGDLLGIFVGHVYFYFDTLYPNMGGARLIKTPQLLYSFFPPPPSAGIDFRAGARAQADPRQHQWGTGYRLG